MPIKTIVFDLGGVLFAEGKSVAIENLHKKCGYNKKIVLDLLVSDKSEDLRLGLITNEEFWTWAQNNIPKKYKAELIKEAWLQGYSIDKSVFDLIKKLKEKYKIIAFSGNFRERVERLDKKYNFRKYFDLEIYSYEYHLNKYFLDKPNKDFLMILLKKSYNKPNEIVYIDDDKNMLKLAETLGINIILYKTGEIEKLKKRLIRLGLISK